jgi:cyclopropane-fatty-acyl-phospholipid synthase
LKPGQTLLDIGCGWGALVLRAAQKFGARCVGVTLSKNQYALARERVEAAGLSDRIEIRLQDYRDVTGTFDRITSVGMFEHVGIKNLPTYFAQIRKLLADGGMAMNHGITSTDIENGESPYGAVSSSTSTCSPPASCRTSAPCSRPCRKAAWKPSTWRTCGALCPHLRHLGRQFRSQCRGHPPRDRREALPHLARLPGGSAYGFERDWISLYQVICTKAGRSAQTLPWSRKYIYAQQ